MQKRFFKEVKFQMSKVMGHYTIYIIGSAPKLRS